MLLTKKLLVILKTKLNPLKQLTEGIGHITKLPGCAVEMTATNHHPNAELLVLVVP